MQERTDAIKNGGWNTDECIVSCGGACQIVNTMCLAVSTERVGAAPSSLSVVQALRKDDVLKRHWNCRCRPLCVACHNRQPNIRKKIKKGQPSRLMNKVWVH